MMEEAQFLTIELVISKHQVLNGLFLKQELLILNLLLQVSHQEYYMTLRFKQEILSSLMMDMENTQIQSLN